MNTFLSSVLASLPLEPVKLSISIIDSPEAFIMLIAAQRSSMGCFNSLKSGTSDFVHRKITPTNTVDNATLIPNQKLDLDPKPFGWSPTLYRAYCSGGAWRRAKPVFSGNLINVISYLLTMSSWLVILLVNLTDIFIVERRLMLSRRLKILRIN